MSRRRRLLALRRGSRGAAAVEFALVVPILFLLVFGIIDYGLYFSNSLATRQATRDSEIGRAHV